MEQFFSDVRIKSTVKQQEVIKYTHTSISNSVQLST